MVLILEGSSEQVAHACMGLFGEKYPICDCFRSNQIQILGIAPYVRTYFRVTIKSKYQGLNR